MRTQVAIIGAGFGGLQTAAELTKHGITDFTVIDKASDFGGVWYWNRYPGASCDIEADRVDIGEQPHEVGAEPFGVAGTVLGSRRCLVYLHDRHAPPRQRLRADPG